MTVDLGLVRCRLVASVLVVTLVVGWGCNRLLLVSTRIVLGVCSSRLAVNGDAVSRRVTRLVARDLLCSSCRH